MADCDFACVFGVDNSAFALSASWFFEFTTDVMSWSDRDRFGEKNERIDFGGVGAFGLYGAKEFDALC